MALRILLPRALDALGDIVPDATAYFFAAGSTSPLTVYEDKNLNTPRGTSLAASSIGVFAECWVANSTGVKIDVRDGDGVSLPGYPDDNAHTTPESSGSASTIGFSPYSPNVNTNVQAAIEENIDRLNAFDNATELPTSTGSGGAYSVTYTGTFSAYASGQTFEFIANHASVGADTLNINTVGVVTMKKRVVGSTSKVDLAAGDLSIGTHVRVRYDGTHFVVLNAVNASEAGPGIVEAATTAEMTAGTAGKYPDAAKVSAFVAAELADIILTGTAGPVATTSGTTVNLSTSIPAGVTKISILFNGVSTDGANDFLVQLSASSTFLVTGYASTANAATNSTGFVIDVSGAGDAARGIFQLEKDPDSDEWYASHSLRMSGSTISAGGGTIDLGGTLDGIRLATTSGSFDAGNASLRWE